MMEDYWIITVICFIFLVENVRGMRPQHKPEDFDSSLIYNQDSRYEPEVVLLPQQWQELKDFDSSLDNQYKPDAVPLEGQPKRAEGEMVSAARSSSNSTDSFSDISNPAAQKFMEHFASGFIKWDDLRDESVNANRWHKLCLVIWNEPPDNKFRSCEVHKVIANVLDKTTYCSVVYDEELKYKYNEELKYEHVIRLPLDLLKCSCQSLWWSTSPGSSIERSPMNIFYITQYSPTEYFKMRHGSQGGNTLIFEELHEVEI